MSSSSSTITTKCYKSKLIKKQPKYTKAVLTCSISNHNTYQTPKISSITTCQNSETPPKLNLLQKAASMALDALDRAVTAHDHRTPLSKTSDPRVQIAGNFAPVPEQPVHNSLPVSGKIPDCIDGVYIRNGANPQFKPVAGHHLFDGDGMVHAVNFKNGSVSYTCRFTETERLMQERAIGRPIFPKAIGELHGHSGIIRLLLFYARGLFGLVDHSHGIGVANAGLVYFNNRILAMSEDDLPYQIRISGTGELETIGRYNFNNQISSTSTMIAHPKIDPVSGELFTLSYNVLHKPFLKFFKFSPDGTKSPDVEINLEKPTMMHDFSITENYVIIPDQQLVFNMSEMISGGFPVIYDKNKIARFGILNKSVTNADEIKWIEVPDCFCFHLWNSWEEPETDEIVVIGSCMTPADSIFNKCDEGLQSILSEVRLNLNTGRSTRRPIISDKDQVNLEAGMVNRKYLGRKTRYTYLAIAEPWPKVSGFAKVDLSNGEVKKYYYGDEMYGGEPLFLNTESNSSVFEEDDGYVLGFVHNEKSFESELRIVNASTLQVEAVISLPSRVPFGFHGTFVRTKDLANQAN